MTSKLALPGAPITRRKSLTGAPESWWALLFLWLVYAVDTNSKQLLYYVLPSITKEFNVDAATIGLYTTLITMSSALLAIPAMLWVDKGGQGWRRKYRHLPIYIGYVGFTFLSGFNWLTMTLGALVLLQIISHIFGGIAEALEVTSMSEWWSKERRGLGLGLHHTGFPWGALIGGLATSALLGVYGPENWRYAFLLFPIPAIILFAIYWWFATPKRYDSFLKNVKELGESSPLSDDTNHHATGAHKGALKECLRNPNISVIALVSLSAIVGYFGISFWLPQYLAFVAHYNFAEVAAYSVLFTITGGLGQIVWGWISDRAGRKFCLVIVFIWLAIAMWLFKYSYMGLGTLVAIQLFAGMALNAPYTLLYAIAFDSTKSGTMGTAGSVVSVGCYLGGFGPYLIGSLIGAGGGFGSVSGYNASLSFISGLMAAAALVTMFFTRETTGWFLKYDKALVSRAACNLQPIS